MERRELDGNARALHGPFAVGGLADRLDGVLVVAEVTLGIGHGPRRLAQHVVGVGVALLLQGARAVERLVDGPAHDELAAQDAHRLIDRLADEGFAGALDHAPQGRSEVTLRRVDADHPPGQHQRPGRGIDEEALAVAEVRFPVGVGDLVGDQLVDGLGVRHAQQRLGQAHQHDALLGGELVLVHEGLDAALLAGFPADDAHEVAGALVDAGLLVRRELGQLQQIADRLGLRGPVGVT